ncbi:DUF2182 domain-containing protein [Agromyces aureus]|uniref:DUF2182 domain-containing protein n=1 Tax=Agromyces aureus TaxID=453304 RepID=A0A191WER4_9MICO|nr:DUF2182 domain-containing protein [Agromyces aureus]ANJ26674.1 hypothetical protein ATC03_08070 [Agromyces aureus]
MTLQTHRPPGAPATRGAQSGARRRRRRRAGAGFGVGDALPIASGLAWAVLLLAALPIAGPFGARSHHGGSDAAPNTGSPGTEVAAASVAITPMWIAGWLLMVVAMMWPLLVPLARRIAAGSFPRWRLGLPLIAVGVSTLLWLSFGLVAGAFAQLAAIPVGSLWWQLAALSVAALARWSAWRARLLTTCAKTPPVAPSGRRGIRSAARAGAIEWRRCAILCGPLMLAMVPGHGVVVLAALSLSVWWEARHPRAWRDPVPLALIAVAGIGAVGQALLGGALGG